MIGSVITNIGEYNPADRLPPRARNDRYEVLAAKVDEIFAIGSAFHDRQGPIIDRRRAAQARLQRLHSGEYTHIPQHEVEEQEAKIAAADAELEKLRARQDEHHEVRAAWGGLLQNNIDPYLKGIPAGAELQDLDIDVPKLGKGETPEAALQRLRREIARMKADLHGVRTAPIPSSIAKQKARAQIQKLAERGRPNIFGLVEVGDMIVFQDTQVVADISTSNPQLRAIGHARILDAAALVAWAFQDGLVRAIEAEIDAGADDKNALTDQQRADAEAELLATIASVEYQESALWWASCQYVPPRRDLDPRAALLIAGPAPQER